MFSLFGKLRIRFASQIATVMLLLLTIALHAQSPDDKAVDEPTRQPSIQANKEAPDTVTDLNSVISLAFHIKRTLLHYRVSLLNQPVQYLHNPRLSEREPAIRFKHCLDSPTSCSCCISAARHNGESKAKDRDRRYENDDERL